MKRRTFLGTTTGAGVAAALVDAGLPVSFAQAATPSGTIPSVPANATGVGDRLSLDYGWRF